MPIPVTCPCGVHVEVVDQAAGRRIRCRSCDRLLTVPSLPLPAANVEAIPTPEAGPVSSPVGPGRKNARLLLACGLLAVLGVIGAGSIGVIVTLVVVHSRSVSDRGAETAGNHPPASETSTQDVGPLASADNKLVGEASETSGITKLGTGGDQPAQPIRKPSTTILDKPTDPGAVPRGPDPARPGATLILPRGTSKITFLNSTAVGQRFCIIADNSGSMTGEPMEFVKRELVRTLNEIKPESRFYTIFFNSRAEPMPFDSWLSGARQDLDKVIPWVQAKRSGGGTRPQPAFDQAFALNPRPDVIFFMTDGLIPPNVPEAVAALNTGQPKVKINTIMFTREKGPRGRVAPQRMLDRAEALLRKIADDSGGTYRLSSARTPEDVARAAEDGNVNALEEAIEYLPRMDPDVRRVIPRLLAALGKAPDAARPAIVKVLRKINYLDASHMPGLIALLEAPAEDVQLFAVEGLTALGGEARKEGLAPLIQLFERSDRQMVLLAVIKALGLIAGEERSLAETYRTQGLKKSSRPVRRASLAALRKLGSEELPYPLLVELAFNDSDPEMGGQAQAILAERMKTVNEKDLPEIQGLLKRKRSSEAIQLGLLGVTRLGPKAGECLPDVLEAFAGDDAKVRQAGVPALRAMGPVAKTAVDALTARLSTSPAAQQMEIALVLAAIDPANPEVAKLIARPLVQNLHPDALPPGQGPPEMLLQSIQTVGEPTVELIFAALEEATGKTGVVAANHRKYLFFALERLGKVAYSEANLRIVASYVSSKKEVFNDVRGAAARARRAMTP